ncbi:MAG: hypothetical protein ACRDPY_29230, partial [Streptosporangiaceae bacterium]
RRRGLAGRRHEPAAAARDGQLPQPAAPDRDIADAGSRADRCPGVARASGVPGGGRWRREFRRCRGFSWHRESGWRWELRQYWGFWVAGQYVVGGGRCCRGGICGVSGFHDPCVGDPADACDTTGTCYTGGPSVAVGFFAAVSCFAAVSSAVEFSFLAAVASVVGFSVRFSAAVASVVGCAAGVEPGIQRSADTADTADAALQRSADTVSVVRFRAGAALWLRRRWIRRSAGAQRVWHSAAAES